MGSVIIRLSRGRDGFGMARRLLVHLDGARVGEVRWNRRAEYAASPGPHTLYVKMDWCLSPPLSIDLGEGETVDLAVTMPTGYLRRLIGICFTPGSFFGLERRGPSQLNA